MFYWWSLSKSPDVCWWYLCVLSKCTWVASILDVCQAYVELHEIIFNCGKTAVCVTSTAKIAKITVIPLLTLVVTVKPVSHYKYLGIVLDIELSDDKDTQTTVIVNKLRAFSRCLKAVKNVLFCSFCRSMYVIYLWAVISGRRTNVHRLCGL